MGKFTQINFFESQADGWFTAQTRLKSVSLVQSLLIQLRYKLVVYYLPYDGCRCEQEEVCVNVQESG